ncbi:MAG: hypothetical protein ACJA1U_000403 [Bermanella sp.]|jgi:hypothetical protein
MSFLLYVGFSIVIILYLIQSLYWILQQYVVLEVSNVWFQDGQ